MATDPCDEFANKMTESGRAYIIESVPVAVPVCTLHPAPWLPDGAAVDWTPLHECLATVDPIYEAQFANLFGFFCAPEKDKILVTSIELAEIWELLPLTPEASSMCNFNHDHKIYRFTRGPPGQRSIAATAANVINSICEQLRNQSVSCYPLVASIVITATSFDESLHRTAQVHKSIKVAGLKVLSAASSFVPRALGVSGKDATLNIETLGDHAAAFAALAYAVLLYDSHLYGSLPYGKVLHDSLVCDATPAFYLERANGRFLQSGIAAVALENFMGQMPAPGVPTSENYTHLEVRCFNYHLGFRFS